MCFCCVAVVVVVGVFWCFLLLVFLGGGGLFLLLFALQKRTVLHAPYRRVQFVMLCMCAYLSACALSIYFYF